MVPASDAVRNRVTALPLPPQGFGDPDLTGNRRAMSVGQVLSHLKARPGMYMTHIIMEYCDRGSLLAAIRRGIFKMEGPPAAQSSPQPHAAALMAGAVLAAPPSMGLGPAAEVSEQALPDGGVCQGGRFPHRIVLRAVLRTARDVAQVRQSRQWGAFVGVLHPVLKPMQC